MSESRLTDTVVLEASALHKRYHQAGNDIVVLDDLSLELKAAQRMAIVGRSGSGKSTLLHVLAGLDSIDAGTVKVCGELISGVHANQQAALRGFHMGFVYQNHHLLPEFSALENVAMPVLIAGGSRHDAQEQAAQLLAEVGLAQRTTHLPNALSGGERQRVAVARALAGQPSVVLADEPTGNLDKENAQQIMQLISKLSVEHNTAFVVVTHDVSMLGTFDQVLQLEDGQLHPHAQ